MSGGWSSTGCVGPGLLLCLLHFGGALGDTPGSGCRPSEGNWGALSFSWGPADLADATRCTLAGTSSPRCCKAGPVRHMHDHSTRVWHTLSTHAHRGAWHTYEPGTRERGIQMAHANCTRKWHTRARHMQTAHIHGTRAQHANSPRTHRPHARGKHAHGTDGTRAQHTRMAHAQATHGGSPALGPMQTQAVLPAHRAVSSLCQHQVQLP